MPNKDYQGSRYVQDERKGERSDMDVIFFNLDANEYQYYIGDIDVTQ